MFPSHPEAGNDGDFTNGPGLIRLEPEIRSPRFLRIAVNVQRQEPAMFGIAVDMHIGVLAAKTGPKLRWPKWKLYPVSTKVLNS